MAEGKINVAVVMSTYNGQRFLRKQIDSIMNQKRIAVSLYIRDDGSKDNTVSIIKKYKENNIHLIKGQNVGVGNSFMNCLYSAPRNFDYYCFADQDDIWDEDKISTAIDKIKDVMHPALYCSNQRLVDAEGNTIGHRYENGEKPDLRPMKILNQNQATGCTMVWNRQLNELLVDKKRRPSKELLVKRIHDAWVAMVASVVGELIYDKNAHIAYRQHENNVVGIRKENILKVWHEKLHNKSLRNGRSALATEIFSKYSDLNDSQLMQHLEEISMCKGLKSKVRLIQRGYIFGYSGESRLSISLKVLIGLY